MSRNRLDHTVGSVLDEGFPAPARVDRVGDGSPTLAQDALRALASRAPVRPTPLISYLAYLCCSPYHGYHASRTCNHVTPIVGFGQQYAPLLLDLLHQGAMACLHHFLFLCSVVSSNRPLFLDRRPFRRRLIAVA